MSGPAKEAALKTLPVQLTTWKDSQSQHPETLFNENDRDTEFESTLDGLNFTVRYSAESKSIRVARVDSGVNWMDLFWFAWGAFHPPTDIQKLPSSFSVASIVMT